MTRAAALLAGLICLAATAAVAATSRPAQTGSRFDLICTISGNRIAAAKPGTWRDTTRLIVDLSAMRYCEAEDCPRTGARRIAAKREGRVYFYDRARLKWWVRLRDGRYSEWMTDGKRQSLITGTCRRARFSGLPMRTADSGAAEHTQSGGGDHAPAKPPRRPAR